jgi:hypothetical protein
LLTLEGAARVAGIDSEERYKAIEESALVEVCNILALS